MLEGLKVVELATYIAAPAAGGILADWGAEVIKIEPPIGCPMRHMFANAFATDLKGSPVFELDNRNKKSIALDVNLPQSAEIIGRMITDADVFITNTRPASLERRGLDYASLKKKNPRLIYANITGYGLRGPDRDRPGFDVTAFYARTGMTHTSTRKGGAPVPPRIAVGDHITGIAAATGILAALLRRERSGQGCHVDSSLMRAGIYALGSDMSIQLKFGRLASTKSREESMDPMNNYFRAGDDHWFVVLPRATGGGNADWKKLCTIIGRPEAGTSEKYDSARKRRVAVAELVKMLDEAFASQSLAHWGKALDAADIVWAPVMKASEVAEDEQAEAAGAFVQVPEADGSGVFRAPAPPVHFAGESLPPPRPAPPLGQDKDAILSALGYDESAIKSMAQAGVFGKGAAE